MNRSFLLVLAFALASPSLALACNTDDEYANSYFVLVEVSNVDKELFAAGRIILATNREATQSEDYRTRRDVPDMNRLLRVNEGLLKVEAAIQPFRKAFELWKECGNTTDKG